jgi:hypothetical protein
MFIVETKSSRAARYIAFRINAPTKTSVRQRER